MEGISTLSSDAIGDEELSRALRQPEGEVTAWDTVSLPDTGGNLDIGRSRAHASPLWATLVRSDSIQGLTQRVGHSSIAASEDIVQQTAASPSAPPGVAASEHSESEQSESEHSGEASPVTHATSPGDYLPYPAGFRSVGSARFPSSTHRESPTEWVLRDAGIQTSPEAYGIPLPSQHHSDSESDTPSRVMDEGIEDAEDFVQSFGIGGAVGWRFQTETSLVFRDGFDNGSEKSTATAGIRFCSQFDGEEFLLTVLKEFCPGVILLLTVKIRNSDHIQA